MTDHHRDEFEAWARDNLPGVNLARLKCGDGYEELALEVRWQGFLLGRRTYRASVLEEAARECDKILASCGAEDESGAFVCAAAIRRLATQTQEA